MADQEKTSIYRKIALDRVRTPENLSEYIRVTTPSAWLLLAAAAVVLAGFFLWGFLGEIEVTAADGTVQYIAPIELLVD
jgi:hypothetical protein